MRKFIVPLFAVAALALPAAAMAGGNPPVGHPTPPPPVPTNPIVLPTPVPLPTSPAHVTDVPTAVQFSNAFAFRNAARFLNQDGRRVRVTDVNSACLRSPVVVSEFGCVFALQAAVVVRNRDGYDWNRLSRYARASRVRGGGGDRGRVRIQRFGCLGEIDIRGGDTVTPQADVEMLHCARQQSNTVPVPTPYPY